MIVDVLVVSALQDEHTALRAVFDAQTSTAHGESRWRHQTVGTYEVYTSSKRLTVALVPPFARMGQLAASVAVAKVLRDVQPQLIVLGGIAGCMRERGLEFAFGDIVVSDQIIDYEPKKVTETGIEYRWEAYQSCAHLHPLIASRPRDEWNSYAFDLPARPDALERAPIVHIGSVFSGNEVVKDATAKAELMRIRPNTIAVEMEAAGVAALLRGLEMPDRFLMIKSLVDFADKAKNDDWRYYCCQASALYIAYIVDTILPTYLPRITTSQRDDDFMSRSKHALLNFLRQAQGTSFLEPMATAIHDDIVTEIIRLARLGADGGEVYTAAVGTGHQYLVRAEPLFAKASRIFATSLDTVSTFWIENDNRPTVKRYIDAHKGPAGSRGVMRLFVFSTPEEAHRHAERLDYHARFFENTFVCSLAWYADMLKHRLARQEPRIYLEKDFAILEFAADGSETYFADLTGVELSLRRAMLEPWHSGVDCAATIALFEELSRIRPGALGQKNSVLKWKAGLWAQKKLWADYLERMFVERSADAFHLVSFDVAPEEYAGLRAVLADIKYSILDGRRDSPAGASSALATRYDIKDLWLLQRIDRQQDRLFDQRTGAELHYERGATNPYLLLIRFGDRNALKGFMTDPDQLQLRLALFEHLGVKVQPLLSSWKCEDLVRAGAGRRRQSLYLEVLDALAAGKMKRFDYWDDELIFHLVERAPEPF
jgi:nucleoside phosphorylase